MRIHCISIPNIHSRTGELAPGCSSTQWSYHKLDLGQDSLSYLVPYLPTLIIMARRDADPEGGTCCLAGERPPHCLPVIGVGVCCSS